MQRKPDKPANLYKTTRRKNLVRFLMVVIVFLATITAYQYREAGHYHALLDAKSEELNAALKEFDRRKESFLAELKEVKNEKEAVEKSKSELHAKLRGAKKSSGNGKEFDKLENAYSHLTKQNNNVKTELQKRAKKDALEKFGPGPHRVKFELDFHPDEIPDGTATSFIIEMAPLDLMPYTVNFFLSQVSLGLLNGCSFHRNARHVVQGGPVTNHLNPGANVRKGFKNADLMSVAFQEYHKDFPHQKYTMGYAGRPGGPDFYVSTEDNTRNHGPGGQGSYAIKSEADPCYAKVVEGFDAVDRMHSLSVQPGDYSRLVHYVAIKSATILDK